MRDAYDEVRDAGAEVVALGTGNPFLARAFREDSRIPFPILIDTDAEAAEAASIESPPFWKMFQKVSWSATRRAWRDGHRVGVAGKRVTQLGSSFVIGPGPELLYAHRDAHSADHAPLDALLGALRN